MPGDVTELLQKWSKGDQEAGDELAPLVYAELRRLARRYLRREGPQNSLYSRDLVHEVYLRIVDQKRVNWNDRTHFFAVSAQIMRRILVDHARARGRDKRGGGAPKLVLNEELDVPQQQRDMEIIALDDALNSLAKLDARQSRLVELRFFAGLSMEETASVLGISNATAARDWATARAWLSRQISASEPPA